MRPHNNQNVFRICQMLVACRKFFRTCVGSRALPPLPRIIQCLQKLKSHLYLGLHWIKFHLNRQDLEQLFRKCKVGVAFSTYFAYEWHVPYLLDPTTQEQGKLNTMTLKLWWTQKRKRSQLTKPNNELDDRKLWSTTKLIVSCSIQTFAQFGWQIHNPPEHGRKAWVSQKYTSRFH